MLVKSPQNHHLESAVHGQRVGQPGVSQWLIEPYGRPGRSLDIPRYTRRRTAGNRFDGLKIGAMEERCAIIDRRGVPVLPGQNRRQHGFDQCDEHQDGRPENEQVHPREIGDPGQQPADHETEGDQRKH